MQSNFSFEIENEEFSEMCLHENVRNDGICLTCGELVTRFNTSGAFGRNTHSYAQKTVTNGIMKDLEKLEIPDDIRIAANDVYIELNPSTRRGNTRKLLIFFCVYKAFERLSDVYSQKDPKDIARIVDIKTTEINQAFKLFARPNMNASSSVTNIVETKVYSPLQFISSFCGKIKTMLNVDLVLRMSEKIYNDAIARRSKLCDESPQIVAAALIYYYMYINGVTYGKKEFARDVNYSTASIEAKFKMITEIDNS